MHWIRRLLNKISPSTHTHECTRAADLAVLHACRKNGGNRYLSPSKVSLPQQALTLASMAASASWTVLLKPDEQLVKATKAGGKVGLQIGSSTTADDFVKSLAASFPVPKGKTVQIYDERVLDSQDSQDGDSYKVMITAADLVSEVQAVMEGADIDSLSYTSTNAGKSVVRLSAGLANVPKVSAQSQAKGNSLSEPEAKSMRSAMDMYCSRDSKSAFHLVTGSPKQWPLAIEAVVASVKLEYPSVKEDSLRSAIVK